MIAITGDVHHMSMNGADQRFMEQTEPEITAEYVDIITGFDLKVTLFVTGKALREEPEVFQQMAQNPLVEFGGHNYYAFQPRWLYGGVFGKLMGSKCGPRAFQNWEIKKTIKTFKDILGVDITSWRNHGYRHDRHTYRLLAKNGIDLVSDEVGPGKIKPYRTDSGLLSLPVNTLPDHDHLIHGAQTAEMAEEWSLLRNKFDTGLVEKETWTRIVLEQTEAILQQGGVVTLLLHPGCMKILDDFESLKSICRQLESHKTLGISEFD